MSCELKVQVESKVASCLFTGERMLLSSKKKSSEVAIQFAIDL